MRGIVVVLGCWGGKEILGVRVWAGTCGLGDEVSEEGYFVFFRSYCELMFRLCNGVLKG